MVALRGVVFAVLLVVSAYQLPWNLILHKQFNQCGHRLPFPSEEGFCSEEAGEFSQSVFGGELKQKMASWQNEIPPGEAFLSWVSVPFLLNFERNTVYEVDSNGLSNPWRHIPEDAKYFMIQRTGFGYLTVGYWKDMASRGYLFDANIAKNVLKFFEEFARMPKKAFFQNPDVVIYQFTDRAD